MAAIGLMTAFGTVVSSANIETNVAKGTSTPPASAAQVLAGRYLLSAFAIDALEQGIGKFALFEVGIGKPSTDRLPNRPAGSLRITHRIPRTAQVYKLCENLGYSVVFMTLIMTTAEVHFHAAASTPRPHPKTPLIIPHPPPNAGDR